MAAPQARNLVNLENVTVAHGSRLLMDAVSLGVSEGDRVGVASDPGEVLTALRKGDPALLGRALHNDLQTAAVSLLPGLRRVLDAGSGLGALGALVSGSGPTVALLARDDGHAVALATALSGQDVCSAVRRADGPVAGARVVETS